MKSIETLTSEIATRYDNKWRTWLAEPPPAISFSLAPPTKTHLTQRAAEVDTWIRTWRTWAKGRPGVTLAEKKIRTDWGDQAVITHVEFASPSAIASAISEEKARHWSRATRRYPQLTQTSSSVDAFRPQLAAIVKLAEADFRILLAASTWFRQNPRSGLLPRQVPVEGMHTKWLAKHRRLVLGLLGTATTIDDEDVAATDDEEIDERDLDALGLIAPPPMIDIIINSPRDKHMVGGMKHLRAPVPEIAELDLHPDWVLVVENKESAWIVPENDGLIVIHSLGNHLNALGELNWLRDVPVLYWGDLDRAGITLLSRARDFLPQIASIMMDTETVRRFTRLAVPENLERIDDPSGTLSPAEVSALHSLIDAHPEGGHLQLEQERLPEAYVLETISSHTPRPATQPLGEREEARPDAV